MSGVHVAVGRSPVALAPASLADRLHDDRRADRTVVIPEVSRTRVLARRRVIFWRTVAHFDYLRVGQMIGGFRGRRSSVQSDVFQTVTI